MTADISDELRSLRRELDDLTYERTNRTWSAELARRYTFLATRELELIAAEALGATEVRHAPGIDAMAS
jgi:hypothetical protein